MADRTSNGVQPDTERASDSERAVVLAGYGLFLFAITNGLTALIGAMIAFIRRDVARGTIWESHYRNMLTVFTVSIVLSLLMLVLVLSGVFTVIGLAVGSAWWDDNWMLSLPLLGMGVPLTMLGFMVFGIWYLYRMVRGLLRALDDREF
jgi:uncharacterized membrane protein